MIKINLAELLLSLDGTLISKNDEIFEGVSTDTRNISNGNIYIALKGENYDGNDFLHEADKKGASCIVTSRTDGFEGINATVISVEDTLLSLQKLAGHYLRRVNPKVVGITGSTGKTTTKDMLRETVGPEIKVHSTKGNFNNHIGLPLTILEMQDECEVLILEMGMNHYGEIDLLARISKPNIALITNIGTSHIEFFGSKENIMKSKLEITNYLGKDDLLILNGYDKLLGSYANDDFRIATTGNLSKGMSFESYKTIDPFSSSFILYFANREIKVRLNTIGVHNVYNSLLVLNCAVELGIDIETAIKNIRKYTGSKMRFNVHEKGSYTLINDAYNASNDSVMAAVKTVVDIAKSRSVLVLGDMLEMGDESENAHRSLGRFIVESGVDLLFAYGENSLFTVSECGNIEYAKHFTDKDMLFRDLKNMLMPGDTVLFKGSRGMALETVFNKLIEEL